MLMQIYLRDKPNREQREKRMQDIFQQQQQEMQASLQSKHDDERRSLEVSIQYESEGLQLAQRTRLESIEEQFQSSLRRLGWHIGCNRQWFELVSTRRIGMLKECRRLVLKQLEAEQDPVGLSEEQAKHIGPTLPAISEGGTESAGVNSINRQDPSQLIHCEPTQPPSLPPPPPPPETADLYSPDERDAPDNAAASVQQTRPPLAPRNMPVRDGDSQLGHSGTIVRPIPGAYPTSSTVAPATSKRSKGHYLNAFGPPAIRSLPVVTKRKPLPRRDSTGFSPVSTGREMCTAPRKEVESTSTGPSMRQGSATTSDTRRTSQSSTWTCLADEQADAASRACTMEASLGVRVSTKADGSAGKKGRGFFSKFSSRRELGEEEVRRRVSRCVGDGFGV